MIVRVLLLGTLVLLSCTAPLYETAEIRKGLTLGGGVGAYAWDERTPYSSAHCGWSASALIRYSGSERFAFGWEGTLYPYEEDSFVPIFESYLNAKFSASERSAILAGIGVPRVVSLRLLQDFGKIVTLRVGGGGIPPVVAFDVALGVHPTLLDRVRSHISGCWCVFSDADGEANMWVSAGIGLEFLPGAK